MSERNPFRIEPPFVVSFSGGRTSGFMLHKILEAYDGKLPEDSRVCFQNTGLEHEITYRFVEEVGKRWCPIRWLEFRLDEPGFAEVFPDTAGEEKFFFLISRCLKPDA